MSGFSLKKRAGGQGYWLDTQMVQSAPCFGCHQTIPPHQPRTRVIVSNKRRDYCTVCMPRRNAMEGAT